MTREDIIVTLTSYGQRMNNLPIVLETIFAQSVLPDKVVLNLAFGESVPEIVAEYLKQHDVEINRVPDTKVYKKLIPTLKKYPEACVISIDDDFLYPNDMVSDFLVIHRRFPQFPISGNRVVLYGMQCHCGCASLTKAEYFGDYLHQIDDAVINHCPSDDMVYTYFATQAGHPYLRSEKEYFHNMQSCGDDQDNGYSVTIVGDRGIINTYAYLVKRFGAVPFDVGRYHTDGYLSRIVSEIENKALEEEMKRKEMEGERKVRSSHAYRFGKFLLKPFSWIKNT